MRTIRLLFSILALLFFARLANAQGLSAGAEKLLSADELSKSGFDSVRVNFDTDKGSFVISIYPEVAPLSSENFLRLILNGFYDGIKVHRVVKGFVVQAGEVPQGSEKEELIESIPDEVNMVHHERGTVSLAKLYDTENKKYLPNSASCQFFINLGSNERLDSNFTVFGLVSWGMDVVEKIEVGDKIIRAYLITECL